MKYLFTPWNRAALLLLLMPFFLSCEKAHNEASPQARPLIGNSTNAGRYLAFATRGEFEETIHAIDDLSPSETIDHHLQAWEEQHGNFYSLRRKYADAAAQGDSVDCPVADDFFAAVVSPEGTVQIADRIYRLDFEKKRVYYIPAAQAETLYDKMVQDPSLSGDAIKYYLFDEDVLDFATTEDKGTPASQNRSIGLGSGIGCGNGAASRSDDGYDYLASNLRLKCKAEYQKFGVYFSLMAKVKCQKRTLRIWWAKDACTTIVGNPGAFWREKCLNYTNTFYGSVSNACDDNEAVKRYYESTRGLNLYQIGVIFRVGNFNSRRYYINQ